MSEAICGIVNSGFCKPLLAGAALLSTPEVNQADFGTFKRPFAANSLWNSRPRKISLGDFQIPTSTYFPLVGTGAYSTAAFLAKPTDAPMTVYPEPGKSGVWDPDAEAMRPFIVIARWPQETEAATGTDGHADIVDPANNVIHSFFRLRYDGAKWVAAQYAWTRLDGAGWGDAAHYFQGARAAAVGSIAGIIRKHEIDDGADQYYHALAMSLTYTGLSRTEQYVFPATAGDRDWQLNTGGIPEGALVMLAPSFNENAIANPALRKVAKTLKTFGAYIIDRNVGTPFYIYVENGSGYNLHNGGWNSVVGNDLHTIRAALRQVIHAADWVDGHGQAITEAQPINMMSMRGVWRAVKAGGAVPEFDTLKQAAVFGPTTAVHKAENGSGRCISNINWAKPVAGKQYRFEVNATGGAKGYLRFWGEGQQRFHTGELGDGQSTVITWPTVQGVAMSGVVSGVGAISEIQCRLTAVR